MPPVVRILHRHVIAGRSLQRGVARPIGATVALVADRLHPAVLGGELLEHGPGVVGAGVVDDDQLEVRPCLLEDGPHGEAHRLGAVVRGHQHAHLGCIRLGVGRQRSGGEVVDGERLCRVGEPDRGEAGALEHPVEPVEARLVCFLAAALTLGPRMAEVRRREADLALPLRRLVDRRQALHDRLLRVLEASERHQAFDLERLR